MIGGGQVPMFKLKLPRGPIFGALALVLLGGAVYYKEQRDPGDLESHKMAILIMAVCVVLAGILVIIATARMWYRHLWHDRYKKNPWAKPKKKPIKK